MKGFDTYSFIDQMLNEKSFQIYFLLLILATFQKILNLKMLKLFLHFQEKV